MFNKCDIIVTYAIKVYCPTVTQLQCKKRGASKECGSPVDVSLYIMWFRLKTSVADAKQ